MPDYLRVVDRSWPVLRRLTDVHTLAYRATGGRVGRRLPGLPPMLLLDHVGAKSGAQRTTPLIYMQDDEDFVLFGAKGGHPQNPAWVHNLRAHPNAEIHVGSRRIKVNAREASAEERERLWPLLVAYNAQWGYYQRRTHRTVPLVILSPRR